MFPILEEGQYGSMYALRPSIHPTLLWQKIKAFPQAQHCIWPYIWPQVCQASSEAFKEPKLGDLILLASPGFHVQCNLFFSKPCNSCWETCIYSCWPWALACFLTWACMGVRNLQSAGKFVLRFCSRRTSQSCPSSGQIWNFPVQCQVLYDTVEETS